MALVLATFVVKTGKGYRKNKPPFRRLADINSWELRTACGQPLHAVGIIDIVEIVCIVNIYSYLKAMMGLARAIFTACAATTAHENPMPAIPAPSTIPTAESIRSGKKPR